MLLKFDFYIELISNNETNSTKKIAFKYNYCVADSLYTLTERIIFKMEDIFLNKINLIYVILDYSLWITKTYEERKSIIISFLK